MRRICRESPRWRREWLAWEELVRHIKIVSEPNKLVELKAELEKRKRIEQENSLMCFGRFAHWDVEDF